VINVLSKKSNERLAKVLNGKCNERVIRRYRRLLLLFTYIIPSSGLLCNVGWLSTDVSGNLSVLSSRFNIFFLDT
jgi:hypothetical protein